MSHYVMTIFNLRIMISSDENKVENGSYFHHINFHGIDFPNEIIFNVALEYQQTY